METLGVPVIDRITMEDFILETQSRYFTRIKSKKDLFEQSMSVGTFGSAATKKLNDVPNTSINSRWGSYSIDCFNNKLSFTLPNKYPETIGMTVSYWLKIPDFNISADISIAGFNTTTKENILRFHIPGQPYMGIEMKPDSVIHVVYTTKYLKKNKYYHSIFVNGTKHMGGLTAKNGLCTSENVTIDLCNHTSMFWKFQDLLILWDTVMRPPKVTKMYNDWKY